MTFEQKQKIKELIRTKEPVSIELARTLCTSFGLTENNAEYFIKTTDWKPDLFNLTYFQAKWLNKMEGQINILISKSLAINLQRGIDKNIMNIITKERIKTLEKAIKMAASSDDILTPIAYAKRRIVVYPSGTIQVFYKREVLYKGTDTEKAIEIFESK